MWFNNSPEAGNWLIDKCAEFGVVPVSFRAHAPNAIIPESYDYHMFVNVGDHQFDNEGTWVQGKSMNVMHQTGNVAWSIFDADYGKYNRMSLENGTGGDMEVTVTITDGKISDIVVNSHAESSDWRTGSGQADPERHCCQQRRDRRRFRRYHDLRRLP